MLDFTPKVLLCTNYSDDALAEITFPAIAQVKCDGARMLAVVTDGPEGRRVHLWSRNPKGKAFIGLWGVSNSLRHCPAGVYDGELLFGAKALKRQDGNALANLALQGKLDEGVAANARMVCWDYLTPKEYAAGMSKLDYAARWVRLNAALTRACSPISVPGDPDVSAVESREVADLDALYLYYREVRARGEEGLVLKDTHSRWTVNGTSQRSPQQIKLKQVLSADLCVMEVIEGSGQFAGTCGSLRVRTDDGTVECKVGSGFKQDDRDFWWAQREVLPTLAADERPIIEVEYNTLTSHQERADVQSLFLPRYAGHRPDLTCTSTGDALQQAESFANWQTHHPEAHIIRRLKREYAGQIKIFVIIEATKEQDVLFTQDATGKLHRYYPPVAPQRRAQ
jgi:ATP-dependent DNA ligase